MTIEVFLQKYFNCKRPFREKPVKVYDFDELKMEYLTKSGMKAYDRFVQMLYDLAELSENVDIEKFIVPDEVNDAVDTFDEIVSTEHYLKEAK